MRHPSIRGIGLRYLLALTLPVTGVILVLSTVAQLIGISFRERRMAIVSPAARSAGSMSPLAGENPEYKSASPTH
jgi:hypothetical protein